MRIFSVAKPKSLAALLALACLAACAPPRAGASGGATATGIVDATEVVSASSPVGQSTVIIVGTQVTTAGLEVVETCTGSIIAQDTVITAAHCLLNRQPQNIYVHFGSYHDGASLTDGLSIKAIAIAPHPRFSMLWKPGDDGFDIGVIRFSTPLPVGYVPAKILPPTFSLRDGTSVYVAGAGSPQFTGTFSDEILRGYSNYVIDGRSVANGTMISLKTATSGGIMDGDSGGPALVKSGSDLFLWGVASSSTGASAGHAYYTDIRRFKTWIAQAIK